MQPKIDIYLNFYITVFHLLIHVFLFNMFVFCLILFWFGLVYLFLFLPISLLFCLFVCFCFLSFAFVFCFVFCKPPLHKICVFSSRSYINPSVWFIDWKHTHNLRTRPEKLYAPSIQLWIPVANKSHAPEKQGTFV